MKPSHPQTDDLVRTLVAFGLSEDRARDQAAQDLAKPQPRDVDPAWDHYCSQLEMAGVGPFDGISRERRKRAATRVLKQGRTGSALVPSRPGAEAGVGGRVLGGLRAGRAAAARAATLTIPSRAKRPG